jgi:hypothetical protein
VQTKEWSFIDKSAWSDGEWKNEPDKVQWIDAVTGLACLIVRGKFHGALCGYVGVPSSHPLYQKEYGEVESFVVHGGLTFSNACQEDDKEEGVCHIPEPGEPDHVWWFGFDCAHGFDYMPAAGHFDTGLSGLCSVASYRNVQYVKEQCAELALQLK